MAKKAERMLAEVDYIERGLSAKEVGLKYSVDEKTVGNWVLKGNWKARREAYVNTPDKLVANLRELINTLTERRLDLEKKKPETGEERSELAEEKVKLADEISKWNKALENAMGENSVPLRTYLRVQDELFTALNQAFPRMAKEFAEFQLKHIDGVSQRYA